MSIILPASKEVVSHNQHYCEKFGNYACQQNAKMVLAVSETQEGQIHLTSIESIGPDQIATVLEQLAKDLRIQGRSKITHA